MDAGQTPQSPHNGTYPVEYETFCCFVEGRPIPPRNIAVLLAKLPLEMIEGLIRYIPGAVGIKLRYFWYKMRLAKMGQNVIIDVGVFLNGPANISLADFVWIDTNCIISAYLGEVTIGRRVHVAPMTIIGARAPVVIEDYVGIAAGVKIYANSEAMVPGKRMSGPMVPESEKAFVSAPVTLRKDSFVGANSVILPGVELGEGAVVGANAVITKSVAPWTIVVANGRPIGTRPAVTVPDI